MNGIHATFSGVLTKNAQLRVRRDGRPWASFNVVVDTDVDRESGTVVRCSAFGDAVASTAPRLTKGAAVYVAGRLSLRNWSGRGGWGSPLRRR